MPGIEDIATPLVGGAVNGFMQQRAAAYNQRMAERNQQLNYKYAMMAQRMAPVNEVAGLRAAGLSPVFADGAQGMSVSPGSAGTAQAPQVDPANLLLMAQLKQVEAQTQKTEADTKSVDIDNAVKEARNSMSADSLKTLAKDLADKPYFRNFGYARDFLSNIQSSDSLNVGSLEGFGDYMRLYAEAPEYATRKLKTEFDQAFKSYEFEGKISKQTLDNLVEQGANLVQSFNLLFEQTEAAKAGRKLTDQQIKQSEAAVKQIDESVKQLKAAADKLDAYNLPKLLKDGDIRGAAAAVLGLIIEGITRKGLD